MTKDRAELASTIAMLVSHELLGDFNIMQECFYEPGEDRFAFPATDDRPEIKVALPPALTRDRIRESVNSALSSYIASLPRGALRSR